MALFDLNKIVQSLKRQDKLWSGLEPYMLDFSILVLLFGSLVMSIQEFIVMDSRNTQISWSSFVGLLATITKSVYSLYVVLTTIKQ